MVTSRGPAASECQAYHHFMRMTKHNESGGELGVTDCSSDLVKGGCSKPHETAMFDKGPSFFYRTQNTIGST